MAKRDALLKLAGTTLAAYLDDPTVIEILINPNETCFVERFGVGMRASLAPRVADLDRFLAAIAHATQHEWRDAHPSLHASLADMGWRIQACRPPQAPGLTMALRKHPAQAFTLDGYLDQAILTETMHRVLREAVHDRQRIMVSGATGSAKTSLVGALLQELQTTEERLCLLEDDPELLCRAPNSVFFRTREGMSMTQLVKDALRYRPDRLIIGEVRDGAALAMARALETGHSGISTVHAESAEGTLSRLEGLILEASTNPQRALLGSVIDLIVHMERAGRQFRCTKILAVQGYDPVRMTYNLTEIA
jgi:P-type conjugative transfer ATPase TrbB